MWTPNEVTRKRKPDFKVRYRFYGYEEGGRVQLPSQGYRSDLSYEDEDPKKDGIHMVWPEFLDESGKVLTDEHQTVEKEGYAFMWIAAFDKRKLFHKEKAKEGMTCFFMEGSRRVAEAKITKIIGLKDA
ncbi:hypothetical protein IEN85_10785 [Pelagicoccus sp. NFK12]|uniref:Uncharacterized protein n=1 Tax=Pelagicoccus enzymogenes TaxID=2773457 RepID=A0A927F8V2_9BACT|nr:hypothetical protein [Pelagicoccus enzymogenes]MBD5779974.1 hypothetical protein [Pelagicoccus enzymogenes]